MQSESLERIKKAFLSGIWATLASICVGFVFKIWLAQWVEKSELALYHTVVDIISLSLILMTGFRSSMVVSYSQTHNDRDIINIFRFSLIAMVLITWGSVIPYIKHSLNINVGYLQLVGIILGMGLKVYFSNLVAMYRLYDVSNKVTWLEPISNVVMFVFCYNLLGLDTLSSLFYGLTLSSFSIAIYMFICRKESNYTRPLAMVQLDSLMINYVKKSFTASLEAGASILMIYITVLLTITHFSVDELGDFQVVVRPIFTYMTMLFVFPIYRFVLPELAVSIRKSDHEQVKLIRRWVFKLSFVVGLSFFSIMFFLGKSIIAWLFPPEYSSALPVLFHFSIFFVFMMLNAYQLAYIKANGKFTLSLLIRLMGIVTLVVAYYLLSKITENVIAIITALCSGYVVMFILSSIAERQILNTTANQRAIYYGWPNK
jgi:O-antigen/teichoic acid export membrane protein